VIGVMLTFMCFCCGPFALVGGVAGLVAVVLGLIALSQIKAGKGGGRGLAIGGIICGILVLLLLLVVVGYVFVALGQDFENLEDFEWAPEDEPLKEDIFEDPAIKLIPLEPIDLPPLDNPAPKTPPDPTDSTPPISPPPPPSPTTSPPSN
jgi:uncharacterized membrane protein